MNDLLKLVLSSQTIFGGFQFLFCFIFLGAVIVSLQHYHANDRLTFNCYPPPSDFTNQLCYDKYISTVSRWLIPRNVAGITYAVVVTGWICFMLCATWRLRQIKRAEQNRRRRQLRKFLQMYCLHVGIRFLFLGVMIGLFCSYQTLILPSVFKCDPPVLQTNTTSTPVYQTETLQCNDLHYRDKSILNIVIIVIESFILMFGILELIDLSRTRDKFLEKLLANMETGLHQDQRELLQPDSATTHDGSTPRSPLQQGARPEEVPSSSTGRTTDLIIRISVESYSHSGQTTSSSHSPNVPGLPVAAGSERMVTVPIHQEQPQAEVAEETSDLRTYIWTVIMEHCNYFLDYLRGLGVNVENLDEGSLLITVTCSSLQILEGLWKDYESGHLNKVAEQKLVTAQVLEKLHLSEVKLKTTISKEEYQKCKEFFLGSDQNYETVDRTDYTARAQSQQKALREVQERTRMEDDEQRRNLDRQRHERKEKQRKGKEEEKLPQLKVDLMNYDFHRCPRIKKESFKDLDVDDIDSIRIALFGPVGSGKTSFVGTLQRAIGEERSAFEQGTGKEGTLYLEEYCIQKKIRMLDTRGFFERDEGLTDECLKIMSGRIRPGEKIVRNYDKEGNQEPNTAERKAPALSKYAHAVIFVLKANDPRLKDGKYKETLQKIREHFKEDGIVPVTVITFLDKLKEKEEKDEVFDQASRATGSSSERTYFIANHVHGNAEQSFVVDQTALDILDSALLSAEKFIRIRKRREKNQMERKREDMDRAATEGVESVEQFFDRLQKKHNWTDQGKKKAVLENLRKEEVKTVKTLKELWEDIKSDLPLSTGMMIALEEEMKDI